MDNEKINFFIQIVKIYDIIRKNNIYPGKSIFHQIYGRSDLLILIYGYDNIKISFGYDYSSGISESIRLEKIDTGNTINLAFSPKSDGNPFSAKKKVKKKYNTMDYIESSFYFDIGIIDVIEDYINLDPTQFILSHGKIFDVNINCDLSNILYCITLELELLLEKRKPSI